MNQVKAIYPSAYKYAAGINNAANTSRISSVKIVLVQVRAHSRSKYRGPDNSAAEESYEFLTGKGDDMCRIIVKEEYFTLVRLEM